MFLTITINTYQLQNGKYRGEFMFTENYGSQLVTIPYSLGGTDLFDRKDEALEFTRNIAIKTINQKYPEGTKFKISNN